MKQYKVWFFVISGIIGGLGLYILYVSNALSYASDRPEACVNCHIMGPQFATWQKSSHARITNCNSCHVPHDTLFRKILFKAMDGLYHSTIFTLGLEPQVIHARAESRAVIQENCQNCHDHQLQMVSIGQHGEGQTCWKCHREVPHGRVRSLSATPHAQVPFLPPPFPSK